MTESSTHRAEILTVGNEITTGLICDTNAATISRRLDSLGIPVSRFTSVGDDETLILQALEEALTRADIVIMTGGLGATHDDITKKALVRFFDSRLVHNSRVQAMVEQIFRAREKEPPPSVLTQAEVPHNATILYNAKGTAPGFLFQKDHRRVYVLPGVPLEMEHLLELYIVPDLAGLATQRIRHRILNTTGVAESNLWDRVGDLRPVEEWVRVASLPSFLGVRIRLTARGHDETEVAARLDRAELWFRERLGVCVFGVDEETLEEVVGHLLMKRQQTLSLAESCTGGLIGHRITNVSGSSSYFMEGAVTYSNAAKQNRLGVAPELIHQHGAVSEPVARAMAQGIRARAGTDWGVAVTGIAGPTGGSTQKPVGLTFIAVAGLGGTHCERFVFHQDRVRNKERAAQAALNLLRLRLLADSQGAS